MASSNEIKLASVRSHQFWDTYILWKYYQMWKAASPTCPVSGYFTQVIDSHMYNSQFLTSICPDSICLKAQNISSTNMLSQRLVSISKSTKFQGVLHKFYCSILFFLQEYEKYVTLELIERWLGILEQMSCIWATIRTAGKEIFSGLPFRITKQYEADIGDEHYSNYILGNKIHLLALICCLWKLSFAKFNYRLWCGCHKERFDFIQVV